MKHTERHKDNKTDTQKYKDRKAEGAGMDKITNPVIKNHNLQKPDKEPEFGSKIFRKKKDLEHIISDYFRN